MIPGLKVHWRDVAARLAAPTEVPPALLEVHLAPGDLGADRERVVAAFAPLTERFLLAVHQPFALADGRILDPLAEDAAHAAASRAALDAAGELAADLQASFLIVHPGGIRAEGRPAPTAADLRAWLADFASPAAVLLENMPGWYHGPNGERWTSSLARTPDELLLVDDLVAGFCLDTSHAWGARLPGSEAHARAFFALAPRILHVHASASAPRDLEGLPLGSGEPGAAFFADLARTLGPRVAIVPEPKGQERDASLAPAALRWLREAGALSDAR